VLSGVAQNNPAALLRFGRSQTPPKSRAHCALPHSNSQIARDSGASSTIWRFTACHIRRSGLSLLKSLVSDGFTPEKFGRFGTFSTTSAAMRSMSHNYYWENSIYWLFIIDCYLNCPPRRSGGGNHKAGISMISSRDKPYRRVNLQRPLSGVMAPAWESRLKKAQKGLVNLNLVNLNRTVGACAEKRCTPLNPAALPHAATTSGLPPGACPMSHRAWVTSCACTVML
jgi:hypothetical protein